MKIHTIISVSVSCRQETNNNSMAVSVVRIAPSNILKHCNIVMKKTNFEFFKKTNTYFFRRLKVKYAFELSMQS